MKKVVIFCLGLFSIPISAHSKTSAYSPSIPGQPLIFHTTTPSISPLEQKVFEQLSSEQLAQLYELSFYSIRLAEGVLGLVGTHYLPLDSNQKLSVTHLYNRDAGSSINQIEQTFIALGGPSSSRLAHLVNQTLTSFVQITNEMLKAATNEQYQNDYQQMQIQVINRFKFGLQKLLPTNDALLKAEAESSLEGLVSCLSLYINGTDSLVNEGDPVPTNMVLARQKLIKNLANFVDATFALQAITIYKRCDFCHGK